MPVTNCELSSNEFESMTSNLWLQKADANCNCQGQTGIYLEASRNLIVKIVCFLTVTPPQIWVAVPKPVVEMVEIWVAISKLVVEMVKNRMEPYLQLAMEQE